MVQGGLKKSAKPVTTGKPKQQVKRGNKVNKPQKAKATCSADKLQKKYAAGLVSRTEKMLGQRAGHLELLGKANKGKDDKSQSKGGTRKFG